MKTFLFVVTLSIFALVSTAQPIDSLRFDTPAYEALDQYILLPSNDAESYLLGFVYVDSSAGFTYNLEGELEYVDGQPQFTPASDKQMTKMRIGVDWYKSHVLSKENIEALGLPQYPEWLSTYKPSGDSLNYKYSTGYHLNHIGGSKQALPFLLEVYNEDPDFKRIPFEVVFAYNAMGNFQEAIAFIESNNLDTSDMLIRKELVFAYQSSGQIDKAVEIVNEVLNGNGEKMLKAEMAINVAIYYYQKKNTEKFEEWSTKVKKLKVKQYDQMLEELTRRLKSN
jgi:tetratricopeptide (TPR) repeat protein